MVNSIIQDNTWQDIEAGIKEANGVILLPIGSLEQHGYHLPVGTDSYVAECLCQQAAKRTGVYTAPTMWFGFSPHHMALPGTVTIRPEILIEYTFDVISSLHVHGFDRFVLVNGHRWCNLPWMQLLGERAKRELGVKLQVFDPGFMSRGIVKELGFGLAGHAEEIETSHMMSQYGDLVHLDRAVDNPIAPGAEFEDDGSFEDRDMLTYVIGTADSLRKQAPLTGGCSGEPSKSSVEKGQRYHDYLVDNLVKVILKMKGE